MSQADPAAKGAPAPSRGGGLIVESAEALTRLLTLVNQKLLRMIRDEKPDSVVALARTTHRAEPNLARTLGKLEAAGLVALRQDAKRRAPFTLARSFSVYIDPFIRLIGSKSPWSAAVAAPMWAPYA